MLTTTCLLLTCLAADPPAAPSGKTLERLQALHQLEAERWQLYLDPAHQAQAELLKKPIYIWTNPTRAGTQNGAVYVWLENGRPAAIGSVFSHPEKQKRMICHEFHALSTNRLYPVRGPEDQTWEPQASVTPVLLPDAPAPDNSPSKRLLQMRSLTREFTAHSIDYMQERWELRLLPQPMYRYEKPGGEVLDGARAPRPSRCRVGAGRGRTRRASAPAVLARPPGHERRRRAPRHRRSHPSVPLAAHR